MKYEGLKNVSIRLDMWSLSFRIPKQFPLRKMHSMAARNLPGSDLFMIFWEIIIVFWTFHLTFILVIHVCLAALPAWYPVKQSRTELIHQGLSLLRYFYRFQSSGSQERKGSWTSPNTNDGSVSYTPLVLELAP